MCPAFTQLEVLENRIPSQTNLPLSFYRHTMGAGKTQAMPIVYKFDPETVDKYFHSLQEHGLKIRFFQHYQKRAFDVSLYYFFLL